MTKTICVDDCDCVEFERSPFDALVEGICYRLGLDPEPVIQVIGLVMFVAMQDPQVRRIAAVNPEESFVQSGTVKQAIETAAVKVLRGLHAEPNV